MLEDLYKYEGKAKKAFIKLLCDRVSVFSLCPCFSLCIYIYLIFFNLNLALKIRCDIPVNVFQGLFEFLEAFCSLQSILPHRGNVWICDKGSEDHWLMSWLCHFSSRPLTLKCKALHEHCASEMAPV